MSQVEDNQKLPAFRMPNEEYITYAEAKKDPTYRWVELHRATRERHKDGKSQWEIKVEKLSEDLKNFAMILAMEQINQPINPTTNKMTKLSKSARKQENKQSQKIRK